MMKIHWGWALAGGALGLLFGPGGALIGVVAGDLLGTAVAGSSRVTMSFTRVHPHGGGYTPDEDVKAGPAGNLALESAGEPKTFTCKTKAECVAQAAAFYGGTSAREEVPGFYATNQNNFFAVTETIRLLSVSGK
jgi:hypothetical protein